MYKVMFKIYKNDGDAVEDLGTSVYPNTYSELRNARRMLKRDFNITVLNKEKKPAPLDNFKVVRSYYRKSMAGNPMFSVRFYIVEED